MTNERRIAIERAITKKLIADAIAQGYAVTVNNGEEDVIVQETRSVDACMQVTRQTDEDRIVLHKGGKRVGWFYLTYGNCSDVICDYSANQICENVVAGAMALADKLCMEN